MLLISTDRLNKEVAILTGIQYKVLKETFKIPQARQL